MKLSNAVYDSWLSDATLQAKIDVLEAEIEWLKAAREEADDERNDK